MTDADERDIAAYTAIVRGTARSVACLAAQLDESVDESTARLERLIACEVVGRQGSRLVARPPGDLLRAHIDGYQRALTALLSQMDSGRLLARLPVTVAEAGEPFVSIEGLVAAARFTSDCIDEASESIRMVIDEHTAATEAQPVLLEKLQTARSRGVEVRLLADELTPRMHSRGLVQQLQEARLEHRIGLRLPVTMLLTDRTTAVLLQTGSGGPSGIAVRVQPVIDALSLLFDGLWPTTIATGAATEAGLTALQHRVLKLLSRGYTEGAIASSLGVSKRTVSRVVADLLIIASARSRFELGCRAALNGWVDSSPTCPASTDLRESSRAPIPTGRG